MFGVGATLSRAPGANNNTGTWSTPHDLPGVVGAGSPLHSALVEQGEAVRFGQRVAETGHQVGV
jgi:hypothetical protein